MTVRAQCHGLVGCKATGPLSKTTPSRAHEAAARAGWHVSGRVTVCPKCVSAMRLATLEGVEIGNAPRTVGGQ